MLVIFDCDGVLVDSEPLANVTLSRLLNAQGLDWSVAETMRRLMGLSLKSCVEICEAEIGRKLPDDFGETLQAATYQTFREAPLQAGARREAGHPGAAAGWPRHLRRELGRAGEDALHAGPHRPVGPVRRPHLQLEPGAARQTVPRPLPSCRLDMNVQPFDCTVVEDSVPGVKAARSAGMRALAYAGAPHAHRDALAAAGGELFDDMDAA